MSLIFVVIMVIFTAIMAYVRLDMTTNYAWLFIGNGTAIMWSVPAKTRAISMPRRNPKADWSYPKDKATECI